MVASILIAQVLSIIYLAFAIGLLVSNDFYKKALPQIMSNSSTYLFGGFLAIVLGMLMIRHHNSWQNNWTSLITIIGWIALLKGITALVFPQYLYNIGGFFMRPQNQKKILLPILLIAASFFGYLGFLM